MSILDKFLNTDPEISKKREEDRKKRIQDKKERTKKRNEEIKKRREERIKTRAKTRAETRTKTAKTTNSVSAEVEEKNIDDKPIVSNPNTTEEYETKYIKPRQRNRRE
ncbi:MAG: hypothetical protein ACOWWH_09860 [Eubacteriaceae bacterium]